MEIVDKNAVVRIIDQYLKEQLSSKEVSKWALEIIKSSNFSKLSDSIKYSICLLCDLDDEGETWAPNKKDVEECKAYLFNDSCPPHFKEVEINAITTRGALKQIKKKIDSWKKGKSD